jgi:hypothetical protein
MPAAHYRSPISGVREPVAGGVINAMADDPKKRGGPDRRRVAATQKHEVDYLAKKHELPATLVRNVAKQVGPSRPAVEAKLREMKRHRGK